MCSLFSMCRGGGIPFGFGVRLNGAYACLMESSGFAACRGVLTLSGLERPSEAPALRAVASLLQAKGIPPPLDTECKGARSKCVRGRGNALRLRRSAEWGPCEHSLKTSWKGQGNTLRLRRSVKWGSCAVAMLSRFAACRGVFSLLSFARLYLSPSLAAITPLLQAKGIPPP